MDAMPDAAATTDDTQAPWRCALAWLPLVVYAVSMALTWPSTVVVQDEAAYINGAVRYAAGETVDTEWATDPLRSVERPASAYVPGLSLLGAPLAYAFGTWSVWAVPLLSLLLSYALLRRLLWRTHRAPDAALLLVASAPALVLSRVVMSDMPSVAIVTAALTFQPGDSVGPQSSRVQSARAGGAYSETDNSIDGNIEASCDLFNAIIIE